MHNGEHSFIASLNLDLNRYTLHVGDVILALSWKKKPWILVL